MARGYDRTPGGGSGGGGGGAAYALGRRAAFDITEFGGKCDGQAGYYGQATSGSATFTDPTASFTSALVGKLFTMPGAGTSGGIWTGTITAVPSSTTLTISTTAGTNSQVASGSDGAMTSGTSLLTSAGATFLPAWDGSIVTVNGAGAAGVPLVGMLRAVPSSTTLYLCQINNTSNSVSAGTTVSAATYTINRGRYYVGSDDLAAWNLALAAASASGARRIVTWTGCSMVSNAVIVPSNVIVRGDNMSGTNPVVNAPVSGSVLRPHGSFPTTAGVGLLRLGTNWSYLESDVSASVENCTIDASSIADWAVLCQGNVTRLHNVEAMAGRSGAIWMSGGQSLALNCTAAQVNSGDCLKVTAADCQWIGGFLRNGTNMVHITDASDFYMGGGAHLFNGYGNSNTSTGVNALIDTVSASIQNIVFDGVQFDDVLGPHVRVAPTGSKSVTELSFTGCFFYQFNTPAYVTWPGNTYPVFQFDTSAGAGNTISRVSITGGTSVSNWPGALYKSLLDFNAGAGSLSTFIVSGHMSTFTTLPYTGSAPTRLIYDNNAVYDGSNFYVSPAGGTFTATGDGTTVQFSVSHLIKTTPRRFSIQANNATTPTGFYVTADASKVYANFATAPTNGAALSFAWQADL